MLLIMYDKHTVNVTGQSSFSVAFALMLAHVSSSAVLFFYFFFFLQSGVKLNVDM